MSARQPVNRTRIEEFLKRLGQQFQHPGRIYLVGGTTMVLEGFRDQSLDVDLIFEVLPEDHAAFVQQIRELKDQLYINVEEASPGDFIPLPAGHKERSAFAGRYGQLDIFHFDLYSTALSKIARGTEQDFDDVLTLLKADRISLASLEKYFHEILPRVATESLKEDPEMFEIKFNRLVKMLKKS